MAKNVSIKNILKFTFCFKIEVLLEAYEKFVSAVGTAYGTGTEQEIRARASTLYMQLSGGKTVVQDLRENSHSSFVQGVINSLTFGLYASKSAEDNIATITNSPAATGDKVAQNVGRVVGAVGLGLGLGVISVPLGVAAGALSLGIIAIRSFF